MKKSSKQSKISQTQQVAPALAPPTLAVAESGMLAVSRDNSYGKLKYYAENHTAKLFLQLLAQQAFSQANLDVIKLLGYRIVLRAKSVPETEL